MKRLGRSVSSRASRQDISPERQKDRSNRKLAMSDAAANLFLEHGYAAVSLDMIIGKVGGSRRDIYELFGNKEELFVEAITRLCEKLRQPLHNFDLEHSVTSPADALRAFGRELHRTVLGPETLALRRLMLSEGQRFPQLAWVVWEWGHETTRKIVSTWIETKQRSGELRAGSAQRMADQFVDMVASKAQDRLQLGFASLRPDQAELNAIVDDAVETFLNGRLASPPDLVHSGPG